jgi:nitric oxide dioxygenase
MPEALSDKTIEIVKSTVPALEAGGTAITDRMYQLMFRHAEVRALFNQSHHGETGSQSKALTAAVIAYARITGVSLNLIRYEFFGPADELLAA